MELLSVWVGDATGSEAFTMDCLRDGAEYWLVSAWYESLDGKSRTPAIAIRVPREDVQETPASAHQLHVQPIAKAVLLGQTEYSLGVRYECLRDGMAEARFGWIPVRRTN